MQEAPPPSPWPWLIVALVGTPLVLLFVTEVLDVKLVVEGRAGVGERQYIAGSGFLLLVLIVAVAFVSVVRAFLSGRRQSGQPHPSGSDPLHRDNTDDGPPPTTL